MKLVLIVIFTLSSLLIGAQWSAYAAKPGKELRAQIKASKPGKNHRALKSLLGDWIIEVEVKTNLDQSAKKLSGTSHNQWILGRRFIQANYVTKSPGWKSAGNIMLGYDNISKEYVGVVLSNFSSGITPFRGKFGNNGTDISFTMEEREKVDGSTVLPSAILKFVNQDRFEFTMLEKDKLTSEIRFQMVMRYKRIPDAGE